MRQRLQSFPENGTDDLQHRFHRLHYCDAGKDQSIGPHAHLKARRHGSMITVYKIDDHVGHWNKYACCHNVGGSEDARATSIKPEGPDCAHYAK